MPYLTISGAASYHEVHGDGEPVVLLHGGFCSLEVMRPQLDALAERHRVHAPERAGHGRSPDRPGPITFDGIVADTLGYLDAIGLDDAHLVGFSDGGIAGLLLALEHPERVRSLVAIGANIDPTGLRDADEPASLTARIDADYARLSPDGAAHAAVVRTKLTRMWRDEPHIPVGRLAGVRAPTLVMIGDGDAVTPEHALTIARGVPGAQLCVVPGSSHLVVMERPALVSTLIAEFIDAPRAGSASLA